jgi:hypothetical protein
MGRLVRKCRETSQRGDLSAGLSGRFARPDPVPDPLGSGGARKREAHRADAVIEPSLFVNGARARGSQQALMLDKSASMGDPFA